MNTYTEQTFTIPELKGISKKTIEGHLKLYAGYVKHANLIGEKLTEYSKDHEKNAFAEAELQRRFSFEFNGMRNHEYYFRALEGGPKPLSDGPLKAAIEKQFGSYDAWMKKFMEVATTRGIGWAMLYWDKHSQQLTHAWVDEQHLGQLNGLDLIIGLDMWEHAFLLDYVPSEKKKYAEAYFENLNWEVIEKNFEEACK
jgi:Fe-Mn family superoxide dismutase